MNPSLEDLTEEVTLDDDIMPRDVFRFVGAPQTVFLTGGTGFLGAFVIADLLRLTTARIYCLVRAGSEREGKQRLLDNLSHYGLAPREADARIVAVPGDLEQPGLALDAQTYGWLAEHADILYHLGASVSFMPGYQQLKAINVTALQQILRLACEHHTKAVHYTSTYAVFNSDAYRLAETVYETELAGTSTGFIRGYDRTKWVAEKICRLAKDRGIPVTIYRAGFISGDSFFGIHNKMDPVARMFAATLCMGAAFTIDALLHLTPVDYCSHALVRLSLHSETTNQIFHLVQEQPLSCMDVLGWLQAEGYDIEYVDFAEWYERLKALCRQYPAFFPVFYLFSLKENQSFGEDENISGLHFNASNVRRFLEPVYHCPPMLRTLLKRYFDYITAPERGYQIAPVQSSRVTS